MTLAARCVPELLISVGGSAFFDRVVARLGALPSSRLILRSGAYVIHDAGASQRLSALDGRADAATPRIRQALEVWCSVLSRPEPSLAILSMGKRDVGSDVNLPRISRAARQGMLIDPPAGEVLALSDQHCHMRVDPAADISVGDLVSFSISHPCTTMEAPAPRRR